MIYTWNTAFEPMTTAAIEHMIRRVAEKKRVRLPRVLQTADGPVLKPRVNHSRWIVDCPTCSGATMARDDELFFCSFCFNNEHEYKNLPAPFPKTRASIERELLKRPRYENRNWTIGETIKSLETERQIYMSDMPAQDGG